LKRVSKYESEREISTTLLLLFFLLRAASGGQPPLKVEAMLTKRRLPSRSPTSALSETDRRMEVRFTSNPSCKKGRRTRRSAKEGVESSKYDDDARGKSTETSRAPRSRTRLKESLLVFFSFVVMRKEVDLLPSLSLLFPSLHSLHSPLPLSVDCHLTDSPHFLLTDSTIPPSQNALPLHLLHRPFYRFPSFPRVVGEKGIPVLPSRGQGAPFSSFFLPFPF